METHYTRRDNGEISEAVTARMCKDNTTGKWDYMGKAYIMELMEEMGSIQGVPGGRDKTSGECSLC